MSENIQYTHQQIIAHFPKLTKKNKRFCELYNDFTHLDTFGSGKASAMEAGYPEKYAAMIAYKLLQKPQIQHYLTSLDNLIKNQVDISKEEYTKILMLNAQKCKSENVQFRYWEAVGRVKGFLDAIREDFTNINLTLIQRQEIQQRITMANEKAKLKFTPQEAEIVKKSGEDTPQVSHEIS